MSTSKSFVIQNLTALYNEHDLFSDGWSFGFSKKKRSCGTCYHGTKYIEISAVAIQHMTENQVMNTMLHEVAHALVGPGHGHDSVWKSKAREVGADPKACVEGVYIPPSWTIDCGECGHSYGYHRRPRRDLARLRCRCGSKKLTLNKR